jgi:hypothetical protein
MVSFPDHLMENELVPLVSSLVVLSVTSCKAQIKKLHLNLGGKRNVYGYEERRLVF